MTTPQQRAVDDLLRNASRDAVRSFAERVGFVVYDQTELNRNRAQNVACLVLLILPALVYRAWVMMKIYRWFAPPFWPELPFTAFVGLALIGFMLVPGW